MRNLGTAPSLFFDLPTSEAPLARQYPARAQQLFYTFTGSYLAMSREHVGDEYKLFGVSRRQEGVWASQLLLDLRAQLPQSAAPAFKFNRMGSLVQNYGSARDLEALSALVAERAPHQDDLSTLMMTEAVLNCTRTWQRSGWKDQRLNQSLHARFVPLAEHLLCRLNEGSFSKNARYTIGISGPPQILSSRIHRIFTALAPHKNTGGDLS